MSGVTVVFRVVDAEADEKGNALIEAVTHYRVQDSGEGEGPFSIDTEAWKGIPGAAFAYWVDEEVRQIFQEAPKLADIAEVNAGMYTSDDFRFLRTAWEVAPQRIGASEGDSREGRGWIHFSKGGAFSRYFGDVHLLLNWWNDGQEVKAYAESTSGTTHWSRAIRNREYYFRSGLTWSLRTQKGLSVRALPEGCIFGHKGPSIVPHHPSQLSSLLVLLNSDIWSELVEAQMAFGSYEVGVLQRTPVPKSIPSIDTISSKLLGSVRSRATFDETTHAFSLPSLLRFKRATLKDSVAAADDAEEETDQRLASLRSAVEVEVRQAYGIAPGDPSGRSTSHVTSSIDEEEGDGGGREDMSVRVANLLQWCIGVAFGRWDFRFADDPTLLPDLPGPFDRLPAVARGTLLGPDGLPAEQSSLASTQWLRARAERGDTRPASPGGQQTRPPTTSEYPASIPWDGILVDDSESEWDILRRVRDVLKLVYGNNAGVVEEEAVAILRGNGRTPRTLRDWLRNQKATELRSNFFDFHINRYSKSRRKAPLYWRLCTSPGRGQSDYGVWLYYPRLTDDTLWTVLNEYVGPKRQLEERRLEELRTRAASTEGTDRRQAESDMEDKQTFLEELRWFESELRRVADQGYAPDLDDGVVINMAPLHAVVPWKEPEKIWKRLEKGEYDWSKLAMKYWPDRVRQKCSEDRSLAIAHGADVEGRE